jgi:hypothetical protein
MRKAETAHSVEERFGQAPGADVATTARRHAPAADEASDAAPDLTPQEQAMVVRLGMQDGRFGNERAKAARDHAAEVQEAIRAGTWRTAEDRTPGRRGQQAAPRRNGWFGMSRA